MSPRKVALPALVAVLVLAATAAYWAMRRPPPLTEGAATAGRGPEQRRTGQSSAEEKPGGAGPSPVSSALAAGAQDLTVQPVGVREDRVLHFSLVGRVVADRRFPVAGASVRFLGDGSLGAQASSGTDGRFRLEVAVAGLGAEGIDGALHAWAGERAALVSVRSAARQGEQIDVGTVELREASQVAVRVTEEGRPAAGAHVRLWVSTRGEANDAIAMLVEADVDSDGRTTFASLPPGWVNLHARTKDGAVGRADGVIRPDAPADPIQIAVAPARVVDVTVVTADEPEVPIAGARVSCEMTLRTGEHSLSSLPYVPAPQISLSGPDGRARIEGLVEGEGLHLGVVAEGFRWQSAEAPPDGRAVKFTLERAKDVMFPVRRGERPIPDEGTRLQLRMLDEDDISPQASAVLKGGKIVVSGWRGVPAIAVAPGGDVAPLLEGGSGGEDDGRETEFATPRTLDIRFVDAEGVPVAGVLTSLWASRFDAMFLSSPDLRADSSGRVRFEQLPSWPFTVHGFLTPPDAWGVELEEVDVTKGNATKAIVIGGERTIVARVLIGGSPSLPSGLSAAVAEAIQVASEENPTIGTVVLRVRPVDPSAKEGAVLVSGRGTRPARAKFPWPKPGGSVTVDVPVGGAPEVLMEVRADRGAALFVEVERWDEEKGAWLDPLRWGPSDLMGIEAPGVRKIELRNGRYRLRDLRSRVVSDPFEVTDETTSLRALLDVTGLVSVRGTVLGPNGPVEKAQVIVEGPGIDTATGYGPGLAASGGRFEARLPAGRTYELRVWHPVLRTAKEGGSAPVDGPRDDIVLRLVEGPRARARVLLPDGRPIPAETAKDGSLLLRSPAARDEEGKWFEAEAGADGVVTWPGLSAGEAEIWIDFGAFAPIRLSPVRIVEGTTDLGEVRLEAGSRVLLRFPEQDGRTKGPYGEATAVTTPAFSRNLMDEDESGPPRFVGLLAGRWTIELHWTDAKGADREYSAAVTVDGHSDVTVEVGAK